MRIFWLLLLLVTPPLQAEDPLLVAVAANFRATLEQLNPRFEADSGITVQLSSAATGVLYNQIRHGAPFHLLLAADTERPALLERAGLGSERRCYALGRLVLLGGNGQLEQLANPDLSLAIANPDTAPYGRAALEVLARPEFQSGNARELLTGSNATQAYQFWHTGGARLALVPLALAPDRGTEVPWQWHQPIVQQALLLRAGANHAGARTYLQWLHSEATVAAIRAAGYGNCP